MEPMGQAKRWCQKSKKIDLPQPGIVGSYNKNTGSVDLLDRFLSSYRPNKEVVMAIVMCLMKSERPESLPISRLGPHSSVNSNIRFDGVNHFITQAGKQSKCKLCKKSTRLWCEKCKVMLHKNCLVPLHTKM